MAADHGPDPLDTHPTKNARRRGPRVSGVEQLLARNEIELAIEHYVSLAMTLLAMLDEADGDADKEDSEDCDLEPSIGGIAPWGLEVDLELDTSDAEPWLGWTETETQSGAISCGAFDVDQEDPRSGQEWAA